MVTNNKDRDDRFAEPGCLNVKKLHPLLIDNKIPGRNLIDLHCMSHSIRSIGRDASGDLKKWCLQFTTTLSKIHNNAAKHPTKAEQPAFEEVVSMLMPRV